MKQLLYILILVLLLFANSLQAQVVFTEIMYDPSGTDSGHEWVEVYNQGDEPISLDDQWRFFDGSGHILNLIQGSPTLTPHSLAVIVDKPDLFLEQYPLYDGVLFDSVVSIGNSGTTIALYNNGVSTTDSSLTFDPSWGGSGNNKTLEKIDPLGSNERENWRESSVDLGTPGSLPNPGDPLPDPVPIPKPDPIDLRGKLIITELLPNPIGSDTENEWIELYNQSDQDLSLSGVTVHDASSSTYTVPPITNIFAHHYLVLGRTVSNITLNNDSDMVVVKDSQGLEVDRVSYTESATEGLSYALVDDQWVWSSSPTPGADNILPVNQPPVIDYRLSAEPYTVGRSISFDASTSHDPEGETLTYSWDFTDGTMSNRKTTSHTFKSSGVFNVSLRVMDKSGLLSEQIIKVEVKDKDNVNIETNKNPSTTLSDKQTTTTDEAITPVIDTVRISEFLPNPIGSDASEWIELYNFGEMEVDISQWQLDDVEGGSKPFHFPAETKIASKQYQVWSKSATKLGLNNGDDSVRLLDSKNNILDSVDYTNGKEGQSHEKDFDSEEWRWQASPTMGLPAIEVLGISNVSDVTASASDQLPASAMTSRDGRVVSNMVEGIVVVMPNSWYKQKFYIQLLESPDDRLVEVYNSRGDFPELQYGDQIVIQDPVDSLVGEMRRLKISAPEQIILAASDHNVLTTTKSLGDITDDELNQTLTVSAKVHTIASQSLQLIDDDATTLGIYLGPDWQWSETKPVKGASLSVTGVVQKSSGKLRLRALSIVTETIEQAETKVSGFATTTVYTGDTLDTKKPDSSQVGWYALGLLVLGGLAFGGYKWWFIGK